MFRGGGGRHGGGHRGGFGGRGGMFEDASSSRTSLLLRHWLAIGQSNAQINS
jgi:hypothetical protein